MSRPTRKQIANSLLERHGRTFAAELGIRVDRNTPSPLFRLLCAALLFSARIGAELALSGAKALSDAGWTTPKKMAAATWARRTKVLNRAGYARYDESTSRMLEDTSGLLLQKYGGDLRKLREAAKRDADGEAKLLQEFKGIGPVGAAIFLREVQGAWDEVYPFVDDHARDGARALGLPTDARSLAKLVSRADFPRLVAALVRVRLAGDAEEVLAEA